MDHEIPFDFGERVPLIKGKVNGRPFDRFLLDTGAPSSRLHRDIVDSLGLPRDGEDRVRVESLRFGTLDVGPLSVNSGSFGKNRIDGLLGTRELSPYCVTLDLDNRLCVLGRSSRSNDPASPLNLLRGRPVVGIQYAHTELTFVLDSGSSGNWLFTRGQDKLSHVGEIVSEHEIAKAASGNLPVRRTKILVGLPVAGMELPDVRFLLSEPDQFGGADAPEDGILGIGAIASSGKVVIDFPRGRFLLIRGGG